MVSSQGLRSGEHGLFQVLAWHLHEKIYNYYLTYSTQSWVKLKLCFF